MSKRRRKHMPNNGFSIVERNGVKLISVDCIRQTGKYEAYYSTGYGGVSNVPGHCSMNLSLFKNFSCDTFENVRKNFALFAEACKVQLSTMSLNKEVHGNHIVKVDKNTLPEDFFDRSLYIEADGQVTDDPDVSLFVYAADCPTIMIVDPVNSISGVTHCGWRNSANGTIKSFITKFKEIGGKIENAIVAMGPSICSKHYDVTYDAACMFFQLGFSDFLKYKSENNKWAINLSGINQALIEQEGIKNSQIHIAPWCNYCDQELFLPSHRRDGNENASFGGVLLSSNTKNSLSYS